MRRRGKFIEFYHIPPTESDFEETKEVVSLREDLISQVTCDSFGLATVTTTDGRSIKSDEAYETFMTVLSHTD